MSVDPTRRGLPVAGTAASTPADVYDKAFAKWLDTQPREAAAVAAVESFIAEARQLFTSNQAVSYDNLGAGFSLRLQDGSSVEFCRSPEPGSPAGPVPVSVTAGQNIKGVLNESFSFGVTGRPQ